MHLQNKIKQNKAQSTKQKDNVLIIIYNDNLDAFVSRRYIRSQVFRRDRARALVARRSHRAAADAAWRLRVVVVVVDTTTIQLKYKI